MGRKASKAPSKVRSNSKTSDAADDTDKDSPRSRGNSTPRPKRKPSRAVGSRQNTEKKTAEEAIPSNIAAVAGTAATVAKAAATFAQPVREQGSGRNNIVVAIRVRPFNAKEMAETGDSAPCVLCTEKRITVKSDENDHYGAQDRDFNYDFVFSSHVGKDSLGFATQESVFDAIGVPMLENALNAYNGCLLAYGQTGAGKSHSMVGDIASETEKGLLPRSCERLFEMLDAAKTEAEQIGSKLQATILASYLEIYQEKMFDLLVSSSARTDLQVRLHPTLGPTVPQLTETPCNSINEIQDLLDFGAKNRAVAATVMNATSSRSHAVFSVELRLTYTGDVVKDHQSKIHFVDLAGSEKQKKTHASGDRLQEGIAINQSLTALSRVIAALSSPSKKQQPPFRESKLTLFLKDALSGNSRTVLVACVSPSRSNSEETTTTLEFASRCKMIKTSAKKNEENKQEILAQMAAQRQEVEETLRKEMAQRKAMEDRLNEELEQTKQVQEAMVKLQEEKMAIERQLRDFEKGNADWKVKEREIEEARAAQDKERAELERLRREFQEEQESRREDAKLREELAKRMLEVENACAAEEERQRAAEGERQKTLQQLQKSSEDWQRKQSEMEKRTSELEEALKEAAVDSGERKRLEEEQEKVKSELHRAHAEMKTCAEEAENLKKQREADLQNAEAQAKQVTEELADLKTKLKDREQHEKVLLEKAAALEKMETDLQEKEKVNKEREEDLNLVKAEVERLKKEKDEQLSKAEADGDALRKKLNEYKQMEEDARRRAQVAQEHEQSVRQRIEQEMRVAKAKESALQKELTNLQSMIESQSLNNKDVARLAQEQKLKRDELLKSLGVMSIGKDIEDAQEAPRLVNLHPDPMLEGCLVYYLPQEETRIGADQQKCRVWLTGMDIRDEMGYIVNKDDEKLTIYSLPKAGRLRVNGKQVREEGTELADGDRLTIGRAAVFRVLVPKRKFRRSLLETQEREFDLAMRELEECAEVDQRWRGGVDAAVMIVKTDYGAAEANALLSEAKKGSEAVAEANDLLDGAPGDWTDGVTHYELAVLFESDCPPTVCVVARRKTSYGPSMQGNGDSRSHAVQQQHEAAEDKPRSQLRGQRGTVTAGIWEIEHFAKERLPHMREAAEQLALARLEVLHRRPETVLAPAHDLHIEAEDWCMGVWAEVTIDDLRDLERDVRQAGAVPAGHHVGPRQSQRVNSSEDDDDETEDLTFWGWLSGANEATQAELGPPEEDNGAESQGIGLWDWVVGRTVDVERQSKDISAKTIANSMKERARRAKQRLKGSDNDSEEEPDARASMSAAAIRNKDPVARKRESNYWPAAEEEGLGGKIVVKKKEPPLSPTSEDAKKARPSSRRGDLRSEFIFENVVVVVEQLYKGRLGVRMRMQDLVVSGFDVPEAEGTWQEHDEILEINGKAVGTKEEFGKELTEARQSLPIMFTVSRVVGRKDGAEFKKSTESNSSEAASKGEKEPALDAPGIKKVPKRPVASKRVSARE